MSWVWVSLWLPHPVPLGCDRRPPTVSDFSSDVVEPESRTLRTPRLVEEPTGVEDHDLVRRSS